VQRNGKGKPSMERKVSPLFLDKGMFVTRLSRPWIDTPFWIQGFVVRTDEELNALRKYCEFAYIDTVRGIEAEFYMEEDMQLRTNRVLEKDLINRSIKACYHRHDPLKQALPEAIAVLEGAMSKYKILIHDIKYLQTVDMGKVESIVGPVVNAILKQPDALVLLANLRNRQGYFQSHAINSCILASAFGRFLGLNSDELHKLASGMILLDIGNTRVPEDILYKEGALNDEELREIHKHVFYSVKLLNQSVGVDEDIINMALTHHERIDGSGYPNALSGKMVPVYGRIAAIIDCFDAMIRQRAHARSMSPHAALQEVYRWRGKLFQDVLVDFLMQTLGTYPCGSLVELNSGEIALVITQNPEQKLKPVVLPLMDREGRRYSQFKALDLSRKPMSGTGKVISILRDVEAGSLGINMDSLYLGLHKMLPEDTPTPIQRGFSLKKWLARLFKRH